MLVMRDTCVALDGQDGCIHNWLASRLRSPLIMFDRHPTADGGENKMKAGGSLKTRAEGLVEFALILGLLVVVVAAIIVTVNQGSRKRDVATELEK
jgi:hypothetical protein